MGEIGDDEDAGIMEAIDNEGDDVIETHENDFKALLEQDDGVETPSALSALISNVIPQPVGCTDLSMSYKGHSMVVSCSKLQPARDWIGWLFAVTAIITIFYIALRPRTA